MIFLSGLGLGLSLIIAIGAQNVFVLRQGLRREHVGVVVVICALSDAVLIAAGTAGLGAFVVSHSWIAGAARVAGAAFLLGYAVVAARRAWRPPDGALEPEAGAGGAEAAAVGAPGPASAGVVAVRAATVASVATTALALTWLNPHVYLDAVLLLGTVAATQAAPWVFAAGAMTGSIVWFAGLGFGARLLSGVLARPGAWRVLDGAIAAIMAGLAVTLLLGL
ncbi:LysE/ArgO family amino acid transporter [Demequina sp. NBRC 110053]|uniref:LysE/ArgO family amino acid transporter n=1 Tax=Demequina sp. NBRC 110053 TaxID=1570342 RepID=UPI000A009CCB|nr:LysE family transporter [Demequina sp. NBRC 110053]